MILRRLWFCWNNPVPKPISNSSSSPSFGRFNGQYPNRAITGLECKRIGSFGQLVVDHLICAMLDSFFGIRSIISRASSHSSIRRK